MAAIASKDQTDRGVIAYFTPAGGQTAFNSRQASAVTAVAITTGVWQASNTPPIYVTRGQDATILIHGALAPGQTLKVRLEVARIDTANPTVWPDAIAASAWASIFSTRGDTGVAAVEHTIIPADLVSTFDGSSAQDVALQTTSQHGMGQLRVIFNFTQAGGGIDLIVATANITNPSLA